MDDPSRRVSAGAPVFPNDYGWLIETAMPSDVSYPVNDTISSRERLPAA